MSSNRRPHIAKLSEKPAEHVVQVRIEDRWATFSISSYRGTAEAVLAEARDEGHKARLVTSTASGREKILIDEDQPIPDHPGTVEIEADAPAAESDDLGM